MARIMRLEPRCSKVTHTLVPFSYMPFDLTPSLAQEPQTYRHRSLSDLVVIICSVVVFFFLSIQLELAESLSHWTHIYERWQLDEIPMTLLFMSLGLVWFGWRRWRELKREMQIRSEVEATNRQTLAQNRRLAQQLIQLQESERRYIARELHDEIGQSCVAIKVDAALIAREALNNQATIHASAQLISDTADHLHRVLRGILNRLRPTGLDDLGLVSSLQLLLENWQERHGTDCTFSSHGDFDGLDEVCTITLYRSVQEGLTNIARHANATLATVSIERATNPSGDDQITLKVHDNGVGLPSVGSLPGLGILGMRERVSALGGHVSLSALASGGTQLKVLLPLPCSRTAT
jgi:glucose-6-phosphate-specific signal transduction histidine kinase